MRHPLKLSGKHGRMRIFYVFSLILCLGAAAQAATGDVVVGGPPGFRIFVDGEFAGVTTEEEQGLLLAELDAGVHTLRAEKAGHAGTPS